MIALTVFSVSLIDIVCMAAYVTTNKTDEISNIKRNIILIVDQIQEQKREINNTLMSLIGQQNALHELEDKIISVEKHVKEMNNISQEDIDFHVNGDIRFFTFVADIHKEHVENTCTLKNYTRHDFADSLVATLIDYTLCDSYGDFSGVREFSSSQLKQCGSNFTRRYCEDGWTVILRKNYESQENFNRSEFEYKMGFGDLSKDFWYGNDFVHKMSYLNYLKLRIETQNSDGYKEDNECDNFKVQNETNGYELITKLCINPSKAPHLRAKTAKELLLNIHTRALIKVTKMMIRLSDDFKHRLLKSKL